MSDHTPPAPATLSAPSFPDALPPLAGQTAFLLPLHKRGAAVRITIEEIWAGHSGINVVTFFDAQDKLDSITLTDPDPSQFPLTIDVNQLDLNSGGIHELFYTVQTGAGASRSQSTWLDLDNIKPNLGTRPTMLEFPAEVVAGGVTRQYLREHLGKVTATVTKWSDIQLEDELWYYLQPSVSAAQGIQRQEAGRKIIAKADLQQPAIEVSFDGDVFEVLGNVHCYAYYFLKDRAGNEGPNSFDSPIFTIDLDPSLPLLAPKVPLFEQHGLINEALARTPVQVLIPAMVGIAKNDEVVAHWGGQDLLGIPIDDPNRDPLLLIDVPYPAVQAAGNGSLQVSYDLWRNGESLGRAPDTPVIVDITLPGGPDPDPETPVHGNLKLPVALGASGVPNVISAADQELPALVTIEWFGVDGEEVFQFKDRITANWATVTLTHEVSDTDVTAKQPLRLQITSEQIKQAGQGQVRLRYSVTRDLVGHPGHANTAWSDSQAVLVLDDSELPGGGDPLPSGDFTEKNDRNAINAAAAFDGTPYVVQLNYKNAALDDLITFKFRGHQGFGDDPALEPGRPFPGSYTEDCHRVNAEDLARGSYAFTVARQFLVAIKYGSANGYHWVSNAAGTTAAAYYHVFVDTADLEP
ncbi:hypothetical protein [Pseudomonas sp. H9]|uniref:hypothetical protein n=1 Tax=Pseudomonas sp. H9 TaxID=483968 RepID=UPI0010575FDE|nr:hypothetical protein [Pseudomonas sp. H9]TDF84350.1 hypothetical protein E1573_07420 [Pseudomonas sp. H9]